jgi:hypothetical protein
MDWKFQRPLSPGKSVQRTFMMTATLESRSRWQKHILYMS